METDQTDLTLTWNLIWAFIWYIYQNMASRNELKPHAHWNSHSFPSVLFSVWFMSSLEIQMDRTQTNTTFYLYFLGTDGNQILDCSLLVRTHGLSVTFGEQIRIDPLSCARGPKDNLPFPDKMFSCPWIFMQMWSPEFGMQQPQTKWQINKSRYASIKNEPTTKENRSLKRWKLQCPYCRWFSHRHRIYRLDKISIDNNFQIKRGQTSECLRVLIKNHQITSNFRNRICLYKRIFFTWALQSGRGECALIGHNDWSNDFWFFLVELYSKFISFSEVLSWVIESLQILKCFGCPFRVNPFSCKAALPT